MNDDELPDPKKSIVGWTNRQRKRGFLPRKNQKIEGIDLTTGGPKGEPFAPAIKEAERILKREDTMHEYHSTRSAFSDANYGEYFQSLGVCKPDGSKLGRENFVPGNGATHLYAAAVQSVLKKDDVLVVPVPTYGFFLDPDNLEGKRVVPLYLRPEDDYRLTPECLDSELNRINKELASEHPPKKVTALLHINPHNPTGIVNGQFDVEYLAEVIKKHNLRLVIDDMAYLGLEYGRRHRESSLPDSLKSPPIAYPMAAVPGMFDKTLTIMSLSKAYNLVDLRAGLAAGPKKFIDAMEHNIMRNIEYPSSIGQIAINAVFDPENKEAKDEYLASRAHRLAMNQYGLRALINGWNNDKEAQEAFECSQDDFFCVFTLRPSIDENANFDRQTYMDKISELHKKNEEIRESEIMLDEAKPYIINKNQNTINGLSHKMVEHMKEFYEIQRIQKAMRSLMETGIPGIKTVNSVESGFFMLLDATELKGKYIGKTKINDASDFTRALSKYKGVYLIPGTAMGDPSDRILLRLSFPEEMVAGTEERKSIVDGLTRLREFTQMLKDHPGPLPARTSSKKRER